MRRNKPGYTTASCIIKNLLVSILQIADSQNACCYVNSSAVKAIAISLMRDDLNLKPGLEFDERMKVLAGLTNKIDFDYIRKNLVPNPSELKESMIEDADISVVTTIDRKISLPVGVYYEAVEQSGEEVLDEVEEIAGHLQGCLARLVAQSKSSNSILISNWAVRLAVSLALTKGKFVMNAMEMACKQLNRNSALVTNARLKAKIALSL